MTSQRLTRGNVRCLLLGSRGTGMSALANILSDLGHTVVGADQTQSAPTGPAAPDDRSIQLPWASDALMTDPAEVCVYTPAIHPDAPLLQEMRSGGKHVMGLHECLSTIFRQQQQLCVAGTHGKSTSAAMLAWILQRSGKCPSYFVGGELINSQRSGAYTHGDWSILESCEFSSAFTHFRPDVLLLTGIERDHFDRFHDSESEDDAFRSFASCVTAGGAIVVNGACPRAMQVTTSMAASRITAGLDSDHVQKLTWTAASPQMTAAGTQFRCQHPDGATDVRLAVRGRHNVRNAVTAMAAAAQAGINPADAAAALSEFSGVRRRFEVRGRHHGAVVVDDYGHHPTAIAATLQTARATYPNRRIVVVFEPHQVSRTQSLFEDFAASLSMADETLLLPVFPARENVSHFECCRISGALVKELNHRNRRAFLFANLDQVVSRVDHALRPTDVLITMGAGTTNLIYDQLTRRLHRNSVA